MAQRTRARGRARVGREPVPRRGARTQQPGASSSTRRADARGDHARADGRRAARGAARRRPAPARDRRRRRADRSRSRWSAEASRLHGLGRRGDRARSAPGASCAPGLRDGHDVVETSHDRIRETIVAQLPPTTLREHHGRLARVLEAGAGRRRRSDRDALPRRGRHASAAARFAESAAEQAAAKLAFDQAARLFRLTLEKLQRDRPTRRVAVQCASPRCSSWRAARWSRRAHTSPAAEGVARPSKRGRLERAAAEQLLAAGASTRAPRSCAACSPRYGMTRPALAAAVALFWLLVYRVWIAAFGLRIRRARCGRRWLGGPAPRGRALHRLGRIRNGRHHPGSVHAGAPLHRGVPQRQIASRSYAP